VRLDESVVESLCGKWLRLMTTTEHAKVKGLPVDIVDGVSKTTGHRLLGNSVTSKPWCALGNILAKNLIEWATPKSTTIAA
jgi:hypothetical protein